MAMGKKEQEEFQAGSGHDSLGKTTQREREVEREEQRTGEQRSQFFLMSRSGE